MIGPGDPRHGHNEGYNAGCHEECCRRAHMRYKKLRAMGRTRSYGDGLGSRRRIQALAAMGYAISDLSQRLGYDRSYLSQILKGRRVRSDTSAAIARLYDELSMTPSDHPLATRARRHAFAAGWSPPLAWDDIDHDEQPATTTKPTRKADVYIDETVVLRVIEGERLPCTPAERAEVIARWVAADRPLNELARLTGWQVYRYVTKEAA